MQQKLFSVIGKLTGDESDEAQVSFKKFMNHLEEKLKTEKTLRVRFYDFVLRQFHEHPEVAKPVNVHALYQYKGLLDLLYNCLFPPLSDEEETLWALSAPNSDTFFYSSDVFYKHMSSHNLNGMYATATDKEKEVFYNNLEQVKYALVLEQFYNIEAFLKDEIIYVWTDKITGLHKYFSIHVDNRFVEVRPVGALPQKDHNLLQWHVGKVKSLCEMESEIPLAAFSFEGFSIVTAKDVTAQYALHQMRSAIIRHAPGNIEATYETILFLLQVLCGTRDIQFGLLPFLKLNNRLVSYYESYKYSIIINTARRQQIPQPVFFKWINEFYNNPKIIFYKDYGREEVINDVFFEAFIKEGVQAYALLPLYHNDELSGLLEVSVTGNDAMNNKLLSRLNAAMPILAQLLHNNQAEFKVIIDKVIKTNFTSIKPAVQWKFNDVAWSYLKSGIEKDTQDIETIRFENLDPLYGAIDIRNSTVERNNALSKDLEFYFTVLQETLQVIHAADPTTVNELMEETGKLQQETNLHLTGNDEVLATRFMSRIKAFLQSFMQLHPGNDNAINQYFEAMDPAVGKVHEHRRTLEQSMQIINSAINKQLELMQTEMQQVYPAYFEKFRTDGVEYDIYIGQSINPQQPYKEEYLHKLQLLQVSSMAAIAKLVHSYASQMPEPLQITQLIFVNANAIDISFRTDEKRFDVEGSYNIRYQIVKKRMDKVHVKNTGERLTQPGKIAIVYSQKEHKENYLNYILQLQQQGLLLQDIEQLELEELQGVDGLKALRVGVLL